jgi:hypothetical protein
LQSAQTLRSTTELEVQHQAPQSFNGIQMPPFYLQDISTILHFEAIEGTQALVSMISGLNAPPLQIYSEEQSQQLNDAEYDLKQKISKHTGTLGNLQDGITRLPLEVVQVSIDEIERMSQRARQVNQAVGIIPTPLNIY